MEQGTWNIACTHQQNGVLVSPPKALLYEIILTPLKDFRRWFVQHFHRVGGPDHERRACSSASRRHIGAACLMSVSLQECFTSYIRTTSFPS